MYFKQFYLGCLAHASYLIGSEGEAAVVDPQRDVDQYINEAEPQALKIKYVIETHLHADFVSGHRELASRTGAEIVFGQKAGATFPHRAARDGDEIEIGKVGLKILETPGHTPESISILELTPEEVNRLLRQGHLILDVRPSAAYGTGHVPGAMNIGLGGQFASWAGTLIPLATPIVLVADELAGVDEAVTRLARVGFESVRGFLGGGMYGWDQAGLKPANTPQIPVDELSERIEENSDLQILDVRRPAEYAGGHVPGAINVTLAHLEHETSILDPNRSTAVICASGYRSSAATSILERQGFSRILNVVGGTNGWVSAGLPVERPNEAVCK